jgi:hypothetical protein
MRSENCDGGKHASFEDTVARQAAELVTFRILNPALPSRGGIGPKSKLLAEDDVFRAEMEPLFNGEPMGVFKLPLISDMETRIEHLEKQVVELLSRLG